MIGRICSLATVLSDSLTCTGDPAVQAILNNALSQTYIADPVTGQGMAFCD